MSAFLLQTALMMLAAYFAGAFLGCIVRRTFFAHTLAPAAAKAVARPAAVQPPVPVAAQPVPAAPATRFERALTGAGSAPPAPAAAPAPVAPPPAPVPAPAPAAVAPAPPAPAAMPAPRPIIPGPAAAPAPVPAPARPAEPAPQPAPASPIPPPAVAAASAAAAAAMAAVAKARAEAVPLPATVLPAAMGTSGPASVTAPIAPTPAPVAPPAAPAAAPPAPAPAPATTASRPTPQDLTRIRAIDEQQQKQLYALGVGTYADIAAWRPEDVARIGAALKVPGRIEQENWIEQAQILAKGGETYYSRRKTNGELATARPTPDEGERITVRVPAATRPGDIDAAAPAAPSAGSGAEIKAAAAAAAAAVSAAQAAVARNSVAAPVPAPVVAVPVSLAQPPAPAPAPATAAAPAPAPERPVGMARDSLQRIAGINAEVERLLNVQGVTRYAQIADWNPTDVARFDRLLGFEGRVARENWIEQAQILSRGGETAYSREMARRTAETAQPARLADALQARSETAAPREDLSTLRSVRSEAYRAADAAGAPGAARAPDDLKRIRGVGVLIEKKLNALGVTRYDQVANWSAADIERFSEKLDFKGRIERENWVEQARILSAGGQTEFSQRVDRGEVETSKLKV